MSTPAKRGSASTRSSTARIEIRSSSAGVFSSFFFSSSSSPPPRTPASLPSGLEEQAGAANAASIRRNSAEPRAPADLFNMKLLVAFGVGRRRLFGYRFGDDGLGHGGLLPDPFDNRPKVAAGLFKPFQVAIDIGFTGLFDRRQSDAGCPGACERGEFAGAQPDRLRRVGRGGRGAEHFLRPLIIPGFEGGECDRLARVKSERRLVGLEIAEILQRCIAPVFHGKIGG